MRARSVPCSQPQDTEMLRYRAKVSLFTLYDKQMTEPWRAGLLLILGLGAPDPLATGAPLLWVHYEVWPQQALEPGRWEF